MLTRMLYLSVLILAAAPPTTGQYADPCRPVRTALVLSGGGATGLAHVGVIRVLDSLGIRPDMVVASSMGAVVGAMYASGYSGRELDSLVDALPLHEFFGSASSLPDPLDEWPHQLAFRHGPRGAHPNLPFVKERELNRALSAWFLEGNIRAAGDFDALPVPLRVVATDLEHKRPAVLSGGDLAQAVRASIAIPIVFSPLRVDGHWLGDGSLTANIPVAIAREQGADRVIVSDASNHFDESIDLASLGNMGALMLNMLFSQELDPLGPGDVLVRSEVNGLPKFDFSRDAKIVMVARGYAAGMAAAEALNGYACRVADPRTGRHPGPDREVQAASIHASAGPGAAMLQHTLRMGGAATTDVPALRAALLDFQSDDRHYDQLWLNPRFTGDSVEFAVDARRSEPWASAVGMAYDVDLGLRAWVGAVGRGGIAENGSAHARVAVGRWRQEGEGGMRLTSRARIDLTPLVTVSAVREEVRRFTDQGEDLSPFGSRELSGFVGVARNLGSGWSARIGGSYRLWDDSAQGTSSAIGVAVGVRRRSERGGPTADMHAALNGVYALVQASAEWPIAVGRFGLAPGVRYGWGRDVPLHHRFTLGGTEGFPGLHLGESRGQHEALVRLHATYMLRGPIRLTVEGASGRTSDAGGVMADGVWRVGGRVGLVLDVPFGPIRIEYGRSTGGRTALFLRVGEWF